MSLPASSYAATLTWPGIEHLHAACLGMVILDRETLSPGDDLFTFRELQNSLKMGPRRLKSFMASRIALKNLSRQLDLTKPNQPDRTIETLGPDNQKPCLNKSRLYCSVSHSSRFVVAVAHRHPVGVDVEEVSIRMQRIEHLFLSSGEKHLVAQSGQDVLSAATRIWTTKEAAAKALGLHLFQALREVEVVKMGQEAGLLMVQGKSYPAVYGQGEGQVVALVTGEGH